MRTSSQSTRLHETLAAQPFLTDGGLETTLVFHDGMELPYFAAFDLLKTREGRERLRRYYQMYADIARHHEAGFLLESPTWRANPDWASRLGYRQPSLEQVNRDAIGLMHEIREALESPLSPMLISGCVGPRGDGYQPGALMTPEQARDYHGPQLQTYREAGADFGSAITMNYFEEAVGITLAAAELQMPVVISFTVETDGKLPTGQSLGEAIETLDASSPVVPLYYMINCAHPSHFRQELHAGAPWLQRIGGLRANASARSHAELDESTELDIGDPEQLGLDYRELLSQLPNVRVFGGCCGTDERHVKSIARACLDTTLIGASCLA